MRVERKLLYAVNPTTRDLMKIDKMWKEYGYTIDKVDDETISVIGHTYSESQNKKITRFYAYAACPNAEIREINKEVAGGFNIEYSYGHENNVLESNILNNFTDPFDKYGGKIGNSWCMFSDDDIIIFECYAVNGFTSDSYGSPKNNGKGFSENPMIIASRHLVGDEKQQARAKIEDMNYFYDGWQLISEFNKNL